MTHNLPDELTSFVGRGAELHEIEELLVERRLLTLTGAGGCGKTRLAAQVGARLADGWPDGFWLADLGSVTDPALVPSVVAAALGVPIEPGANPADALAAILQPRRMLLCLDTCEHVLDAAATLTETLLRRCPAMSVLATSREPLALPGETIWLVPPLRPDEAIRLFGDRAGLVAPRFDVDEVRDDVVAVCAQVDHLPLAIELAAAWVRALSPAQIAAGLAESSGLLAGAPRGVAARHQTLLASMNWSHTRLADDEKTFFRRLAVFAGTFTLEAAAAVADIDDALPLIGRLLDTSLVTARDVQKEIRYRLLDTVRQYAEEKLRTAGEDDLVRDRHLDYFLALAEDAEPGLDTDQDRWRVFLDGHRANLNAALRWGLATERKAHGRRLAAALAGQWFIRGQSAEALDFLSKALDDNGDDSVQARLLAGTAMIGMISGRNDLIAEAAARGRDIAERAGNERARARCLVMSAFPWFFRDFARCHTIAAEAGRTSDPFARDWAAILQAYSLQTRNRHAEAVAAARPAFDRSLARGDRFCAAFARGVEIFTTMVGGDVPGAVAIGTEVLDIVRPLGDFFAVGTNTVNAAQAVAMAGELDRARALMEPIVRSIDTAPEVDVVGFMVPYGLLHLWAGDLEAAVGWFRRGTRTMTDSTCDWTAARCLPGLVGALRRLGRIDEAARLAVRAVDIETGFGAMYELSGVLDEQASLAEPDRARDVHLRALAVRRAYGLRAGYADSLDALAALEAATDPVAAARLVALGESGRAAMGYPRPPVARPEHDALLAALHNELGDERFAAASAEGAAADLDTTVAALTRGRGPRRGAQTGWEALTDTELDVVRLVAGGLSNPEIATRLYMSRGTVKAHLTRIFTKVGVANRTELAIAATTELDPPIE